MAENPYDNDVAIDPVQRAVEERIRREALRQLDTVDIEDDHSRIESAPDAVPNPLSDLLGVPGTEPEVDVTAESLIDKWDVDGSRAPYD